MIPGQRLLLLCAFLTLFLYYGEGKKRQKPTHVFTDGDVIIGGLSPVHFSPTEKEEMEDPDSYICQGKFNTRGFEAVEAMLFAMDMLNEGKLKDKVLPNITVGMDIKETCTSADYAVRESLNFSFIRNAHIVGQQCAGYQMRKTRERTVSVVGAAYSGVSMAVTNLCSLFYVPLVSYASTSRLLSNKVQFRYFFRTVPSDMLQAQVMADLVRFMKWNFVITLASDTEYGRSGIESFKNAVERFEDYPICIAVDETFTKRSSEETFTRIFNKMRENPYAKVVILFAELHDADILISRIRDEDVLNAEHYIWIGSDAWSDSLQIVKTNEATLNGMFAIVPEVRRIKEFDEYFVNFNDKRRKRNLWMQEYEEIMVAHDPAFHRQTFTHYPKAAYVVDAVLATAYALHDLLGCQPYKNCNSRKSMILKQDFQKKFVNYLEKVKFKALSKDSFSFDKSGDAIGLYDIKHLKLVGKNYEFSRIGRWGSKCDSMLLNSSRSSACLEIHGNQIDHRLMNSSHNGVPFSRCSASCPAGFHKVSEKKHSKCCWSCRRCPGNTVTNKTNMDDCVRCPRGYWASVDHAKCEVIPPNSLHWSDPLGVCIVCLSGFGTACVIFAFVVFFLNRQTPVVRASSVELCYVLLFGIVWCYVTPLFFIAKPSDTICRAIPFITGLCPSLVAGTLLTKTNRISRIFNRKLSKTGTPSCLSKQWQLLMVAWLTLIEILICSGNMLATDTGSKLVISDSKKEVLIECKELPDIGLAIWWAYNAGLVLTCTYQAFLTRKLPENYNEAKFIAFTMLTTCIVVTVFVPTYIGTSGVYRTTITCFVFIIGGSSSFACIFVPKLYIILWRPEKNIPMQPRSQSLRLGTITPSASFVRRLSIDGRAPGLPGRRRAAQRINSLPTIETAELQAVQLIKKQKTRRSASLSPDFMVKHGVSPEIKSKMGLKRKMSRSVPYIHKKIEEDGESDSSLPLEECAHSPSPGGSDGIVFTTPSGEIDSAQLWDVELNNVTGLDDVTRPDLHDTIESADKETDQLLRRSSSDTSIGIITNGLLDLNQEIQPPNCTSCRGDGSSIQLRSDAKIEHEFAERRSSDSDKIQHMSEEKPENIGNGKIENKTKLALLGECKICGHESDWERRTERISGLEEGKLLSGFSADRNSNTPRKSSYPWPYTLVPECACSRRRPQLEAVVMFRRPQAFTCTCTCTCQQRPVNGKRPKSLELIVDKVIN